MAEKIKFKATPIKLFFENRDNDYRIYAIDTRDKNVKLNKYGNATVLGICHSLELGYEYVFYLRRIAE